MSTIWPTRTEVKNLVSAMGVSIPARVTDSTIDLFIAAASANFVQHTKRTWTPTTEVRTFNGSGTGMLEIDDYISISTVTFIGNPTVIALPIDHFHEVSVANYPKNRIQIYQGGALSFNNQWITAFPSGRSNIEINANWGYGASIPSDVWLCVAYQSVAMIVNFTQFDINGYLIKFSEADVTEVRNRYDPFQFFTKGALSYRETVKLYKLPSSRYTRRQAKILI